MIRRNPTLIALTDNDVQDVRDAVKKKTQAPSNVNINAKDTLASSGEVYRKLEEERKKKAAQTREERLGIS